MVYICTHYTHYTLTIYIHRGALYRRHAIAAAVAVKAAVASLLVPLLLRARIHIHFPKGATTAAPSAALKIRENAPMKAFLSLAVGSSGIPYIHIDVCIHTHNTHTECRIYIYIYIVHTQPPVCCAVCVCARQKIRADVYVARRSSSEKIRRHYLYLY